MYFVDDYLTTRNDLSTIHSVSQVFNAKKKKSKNERIRNTMKELFYLEAKRGKRDQRGAVKSNFDKFKSNLNDRLQFCSKTKGRGGG